MGHGRVLGAHLKQVASAGSSSAYVTSVPRYSCGGRMNCTNADLQRRRRRGRRRGHGRRRRRRMVVAMRRRRLLAGGRATCMPSQFFPTMKPETSPISSIATAMARMKTSRADHADTTSCSCSSRRCERMPRHQRRRARCCSCCSPLPAGYRVHLRPGCCRRYCCFSTHRNGGWAYPRWAYPRWAYPRWAYLSGQSERERPLHSHVSEEHQRGEQSEGQVDRRDRPDSDVPGVAAGRLQARTGWLSVLLLKAVTPPGFCTVRIGCGRCTCSAMEAALPTSENDMVEAPGRPRSASTPATADPRAALG